VADLVPIVIGKGIEQKIGLERDMKTGPKIEMRQDQRRGPNAHAETDLSVHAETGQNSAPYARATENVFLKVPF